MNAIIYARYSSDSQREESIEGQIRECTEYAERSGLTIVSSYIDRALSAKTDNRPEFQRMIRDSAKRQFEIVLVWKLDRFSRNRTDSAINKVILKKNGVRVVSVKENISEGPEGIILEAMLEGYAEYYSAELSQKINRGLTENALKGKYNGGSLPLGYTTDENQRFKIDIVTAPIVREIFTRYADGETIVEITDSLNKRGLRSSRGSVFNKNSLHTMLKNRRYIGEYHYKDVIIPDSIPAIIPQELFDKVQKRLEKNRKAPAMAKAEVDYLLTTKLFCGHCGAYMIGESGRGKMGVVYNYYKCGKAKRGGTCKKKTVRKEEIERLVVAETKRLVFHENTVENLADKVLVYQSKENTALPMLQKDLRDVEKGIDNMLNAIQQGIITDSTKQRLEALEARKEDLIISIAQEKIEKPMLTKEQVVSFLNSFLEGDIDDPAHRQRIIDCFVNSVYLHDDHIKLFVNFKDGAKTVTLDQILSSDLALAAPLTKTLEPMRF